MPGAAIRVALPSLWRYTEDRTSFELGVGVTTFDLAEVRHFTADLEASLSHCDNGEGLECATLDGALRHYARLCCEFREEVRRWGRAVFAGRIALDPEVERTWRDEGYRLYTRAYELFDYATKTERVCYMLDGRAVLGAALWDLLRLLSGWVTPQLAVGPAARQGAALSAAIVEEGKRRLDAMPPLPADWKPSDPRRQALFNRFRRA